MANIVPKTAPEVRAGLRFHGVQARLAVSFGLTFALILVVVELVGFFGLPLGSYRGRTGNFKQEAFHSLEFIADLKEERLRYWFDVRQKDLSFWAGLRIWPDQLRSLLPEVDRLTAQGLLGERLGEKLRQRGDLLALTDRLDSIRRIFPEYRRIFLADAGRGKIFASTVPSNLGADVAGRPFFTGALGRSGSFIGAANLLDKSDEPVFHMSQAIRDQKGQAIAVIVLEIETGVALAPLLHTGEGLGTRGEALLIDESGRILVPLKHALADGSHPKPLQYRIQAEPALRAQRGERGVVETLDYRGVPVLAAYRFIGIAPGVGWGLVVKRDRSELLAPLRQEIYDAAVIDAIGVLAVMLTAFAVARSVTRPVRALAGAAEQAARGDLTARAPIAHDDEVGALARTFNDMIQHIQDSQEALVRQERLAALGQLIATVGHELRNPLGTIRTSLFFVAQRLRGKDLGVEAALERMERGIVRCDGIISDLLDYSGNRPLDPRPTDLDPWLAALLDEYELPANVALERQLNSRAVVSLGQERFRRCMLNLLNNACQAIEGPEGRVSVSTSVEDFRVAVRIADTGCGIAPDMLEKIFEPLYSTKSFGVGLGLPIIRQIVDRHGGTVEVQSQVGRGTTFTVWLPPAAPSQEEKKDGK